MKTSEGFRSAVSLWSQRRPSSSDTHLELLTGNWEDPSRLKGTVLSELQIFHGMFVVLGDHEFARSRRRL